MRLRIPQNQIEDYAAKYSYPKEETEMIGMRETVETAGHLTKTQLQLLAKWKSPRSAGRIENNTEGYIREITSFALSTSDERARIEALTLLDGVLWPTASVVLHLFHDQKYPILDYRALWSVSTEVPTQYSFQLWGEYVHFCRTVATKSGVSMRVLDRALWQYSKLHQPKREA